MIVLPTNNPLFMDSKRAGARKTTQFACVRRQATNKCNLKLFLKFGFAAPDELETWYFSEIQFLGSLWPELFSTSTMFQ